MAKRVDSPHRSREAGHRNADDHGDYERRIGGMLIELRNSDAEARCRMLALADWPSLDPRDAIALLVPLVADPDPQVRELVGLQLGSIFDATANKRALPALGMLAADPVASVRRALSHCKMLAQKAALTLTGQFETSLSDPNAKRRNDDESVILTFRCPDAEAAQRIVAIATDWCGALPMTGPNTADSSQPPFVVDAGKIPDSRREPDFLIDDPSLSTPFDLPRPGRPVTVVAIYEASERLPDALLD